MNKRNIIEIVFAIVLVVLGIILVNPMNLWMPDMAQVFILALIVAVLGALAGLFYRETAGDEREATHRMLADRAGFLIGAIILVTGLIYQGVSHTVDYWLVIALVAMVVGKIVVRFYSDHSL